MDRLPTACQQKSYRRITWHGSLIEHERDGSGLRELREHDAGRGAEAGDHTAVFKPLFLSHLAVLPQGVTSNGLSIELCEVVAFGWTARARPLARVAVESKGDASPLLYWQNRCVDLIPRSGGRRCAPGPARP